MPSSMPHLITARFYSPCAAPLFFAGSLAPDSVTDWKRKDEIHYRDVTNREEALRALVRQTNPADPFSEGILLHLFLDWKWDTGPRQDFIIRHGKDCFALYREEIGALSARLYHQCPWSGQVWDQIQEIRQQDYPQTHDVRADEIIPMIARNARWHKENDTMTPSFYDVDAIMDFLQNTAREYRVWRSSPMQ